MNARQANPTSPLRAVLYLRVSTGLQAQKDLSVPDQRSQLEAHCQNRGWCIVDEFVEIKSAFQGPRPVLDELLSIAKFDTKHFERIVVHSFSRFFRDEVEAEIVIRDLRKRGIEVVSMTQDVGHDEMGDLVRRFIMLFDEHSSRETSKHVRRTLRENAKQGFWCGGRPPYGFRTYDVEKRSKSVKKKLEVHPVEADVVLKMFDLLEQGDGKSGPMGVKRITSWLNENGFRTRGGKNWSIGAVHKVLSGSVAKGEFFFGKKAGAENPVLVPTPEIIPAHRFDMAQQMLRDRNPKKTPPRDTTSDILLSKIARCGHCGSGMTISTGKSGRYRYYKCSGEMRKGKSTCPGMCVPMDRFDQLIIENVSAQLLTEGRVKSLLSELMKRQATRRMASSGHLAQIRRELDEAETSLRRVYGAIANGAIDAEDPTLRESVAAIKDKRDMAKAAEERALEELQPHTRLTNGMVKEFTGFVRDRLRNGTPQFRRQYLRTVVDKIIVNKNEIKILGR